MIPRNPSTLLRSLLALLLASSGLHATEATKPNIILIFADDLGYGDLGVLHQNQKSGKRHKTPFLDQMANEGMILDRHYCPAPVCAPSRSSLLSGLHQGHANVRDNQFDKALEDNHNLASTLKAAGYHTAIIGKWGLQGQDSGNSPESWPAYPTKRGFDFFYGMVRHRDGHLHYPNHVWPLAANKGHKRKVEVYDQHRNVQEDLTLCYSPDLFTARAKKFIADEVNDGDDQPFFLYLAYSTPHAALQLPPTAYPGWNPDKPDDDSGFGLKGGVQWLGEPGRMINTAAGEVDSYRHPDYTGKGWSDVEERFATMVRRMDDNVADLRKTLRDLGIEKDTLIVFTSDNGPHSESYMEGKGYTPQSFQSYGPFVGQKRDCWEGGIREPTLVVWPGTIPAGSKNTTASQFHDWLPTFCDLAGLPAPVRTDGVSLKPLLLDPGATLSRTPTTYIEYTNNGRTPGWKDFAAHAGTPRKQAQVIFIDGFKGIRNDPGSHQTDFRIYDTLKDPGERSNLAGKDGFKEIQQRMKDTVLRIRRPDESAPRNYIDKVPVPALSNVPKQQAGLRFKRYSGSWPWLPEFRDLEPVSSGVFKDGIALGKLPESEDPSGLLISGLIEIPATGKWTFHTSSDSGSFLRIHEIMVIDDDYTHDGSETSGSLLLEKGLHPIRLYYRNLSGKTPSLSLSWSGPDVPKTEIPASAYFSK